MALTIRSINADASFLLTFSALNDPSDSHAAARHFTILIDPWLGGPSTQLHSKFSTTFQKVSPCITSLQDLDQPDLVIISQAKSDHCHKESLRSLNPNAKSVILAPSGAAKVIKGWKYFAPNKVKSMKPWQPAIPERLVRIRVPSSAGGTPGEVTVAWMPEKRDITGLHGAIGITYRPPATREQQLCTWSPRASPSSDLSPTESTSRERALSVIFSPHGCSYETLKPYACEHLVSEAALPLTALLHCFDRVSNPWWLGGNICTGFPGGLETAQNLMAKVWISTHDAEKTTSGFGSQRLVIERYRREEVDNLLNHSSEQVQNGCVTEIVVLNAGEETRVT